jgi:hypothetical protein
MLDVFMVALGLGSFWWRWVVRMPADVSEENETGIRLHISRQRRGWLAMLLALRTAAA